MISKNLPNFIIKADPDVTRDHRDGSWAQEAAECFDGAKSASFCSFKCRKITRSLERGRKTHFLTAFPQKKVGEVNTARLGGGGEASDK